METVSVGASKFQIRLEFKKSWQQQLARETMFTKVEMADHGLHKNVSENK